MRIITAWNVLFNTGIKECLSGLGGLMEEHIELETRIYIHPKQSRYFDIYPETAIPYKHQNPYAKIELCEAIDLGYDYVMIPLQIYIYFH